jgi:hypothetical protein
VGAYPHSYWTLRVEFLTFFRNVHRYINYSCKKFCSTVPVIYYTKYETFWSQVLDKKFKTKKSFLFLLFQKLEDQLNYEQTIV